MRTLARGAFFLSGIAGLTFEIVWFRHLNLSMGATTLAVATTTAAYMGGLALGSHLGGKLADRFPRPLLAYGALEIAIGLAGLAVPLVTHQVSAVDAALFGDWDSAVARALVRFAVAGLILALPTTAMGMTLPILARAVTRHAKEVGREVGILYAINIAGAMAGAALTGFFFVPAVGLAATNGIAVGLDVLLGLTACAAGWLLAPVPPTPEESDRPLLRPASGRLVLVLAVTGAAAMSLQVLWTRALGTALGPSTYAFTAIVCTYLAGLAIGGALASRLADSVLATRYALALVLVLTGTAALAGIAVVDDLPLLLRSAVLDPSLSIGGLIRTQFGLAALSVLPATIGMGAIFPLTIAAVVGSHARLGAAVGRAYAVNTVGAIFGSFAGVFILLPLFGVEWGMRLSAVAYLAMGALLAFRLEASVEKRQALWLRLGAGAALVIALAWPSWHIGRWTLGMYRLSMTRSYFDGEVPEPSPVVFHEDGLAATVTVEQEAGVRWIKVDGKIDGSSEGDMPTQVLSGLLASFFRPDAEKVAVIGCGSCVTIGTALRAGPKAATLVEIERAVLDAAPHFEKVNGAPWKDPRLTIALDDGRNFMRRTRDRFDIIISEPSNPWMSGAASLFTVEFFELARTRLAERGVFLQWLQIYELAPERIESMLRTFNQAFPHVVVFSAHVDSNDLLMIGSREPLALDWEGVVAHAAKFHAELERADIQAPEELIALILASEREIAPLTAPLNTDDNALIEFGAPRDLVDYAEKDPEVPLLASMAGRRLELVKRLVRADAAKWPELAARLAEGYLRQGMLDDAAGTSSALLTQYAPEASKLAGVLDGSAVQRALLVQDSPDAARLQNIYDAARLLDGDDSEAVISPEGKGDGDYVAAARLVAEGEDDAALRLFEKNPALGKRSSAHALLHGYLLYRAEEYEEARRTLARAHADEAFRASHPALSYYLAKSAFGDGDYELAATTMRSFAAQSSAAVADAAK